MSESDTGKRIKQIMQAQQLTQKELADFLEISQPAVSVYLKGRQPPADILFRLAQLGNTTMEWLLTGEASSGTVRTTDRIREQRSPYGRQTVFLQLWEQLPAPVQMNLLNLMRHLTHKSNQ